jgi:spermidine synthase
MTQTASIPQYSAGQAPGSAVVPSAIALTSFATLLLELALTRLFSVVLFYHFAFLAISVALLGLGAGGVFAYLRQQQLARYSTPSLGSFICLLNALVTVVALEVVLHMPISIQLTGGNFLRLTVLYLASAFPFFLTGILFSVVFARESGHIPLLYGADLAGGAVACLALVPLLNWIGGPNAILFSGVAMMLASALWAPSVRTRNRGLILAAALSVLIAINYRGALIDVIYAKGERRDRSTGVEFVRWNAISRVEVNAYPNGGKNIRIDADAGTAIMNTDHTGWQGTPWEKVLMDAAPAVVNVLRPHGEYAIIGPGGGVDVLRAVAAGSPRVTGIEINPIIATDIMRERYAEYSYHLYQIPQVHIHVSDGRSFVRNSRDRYDVLQMTLVDTWASTAAGAFALSENNLYTVEAFGEYLEHLKSDGMLAITRWEFRQPREALRVVSVATEALHRIGVENPSGNFILVSDGSLEEDGRPVLVLAKRSPFTAEEQASVQAYLAQHAKLLPLYLPSSPGDNVFSRLIAKNDARSFAAEYEFNVAPVTDNAPFFFFTLNSRQMLERITTPRGIDWKVNLGVVVLGMVLIISIVAVALFLLLPLLMHARGQSGGTWSLLYFIAVGLGYILVEIAFIQRFVLFLGHPTYALTVVIFLLLLSSGAGSLVSRRWIARPMQGRWALAGIILGVVLYVFVLPTLLPSMVGLPFVLKLVMSAVLLLPLGFAMGMPFPTGLRAIAADRSAAIPADQMGAVSTGGIVEWAWAMNAASSVLGSVLAIVIAINFGLNVTLACGAVAYGVALILTGTLGRTYARG